MAEVLCVYREVQVLKKAAAKTKNKAKKKSEKPRKRVAIVSYDEKRESRRSRPHRRICRRCPHLRDILARSMSYKRHGTLSLLPGSICLTGKVPRLGQRPHRSPSSSNSSSSSCRLPGRHGDQADPGQPFGPYLQRTKPGRCSAGGPLRVHLHAQARLLA